MAEMTLLVVPDCWMQTCHVSLGRRDGLQPQGGRMAHDHCVESSTSKAAIGTSKAFGVGEVGVEVGLLFRGAA